MKKKALETMLSISLGTLLGIAILFGTSYFIQKANSQTEGWQVKFSNLQEDYNSLKEEYSYLDQISYCELGWADINITSSSDIFEISINNKEMISISKEQWEADHPDQSFPEQLSFSMNPRIQKVGNVIVQTTEIKDDNLIDIKTMEE